MSGMKLFAIVTLSLCGYIGAASVKPRATGDELQLPTDPILLARYVVHKADWLSLATISSLKGLTGYPFVNIKSTSDGPNANPSGIPYVYMTDLETSSKDLEKDDRATIMVTLAQTDYCKKQNIDQQNPTCPRVFIVGKFVRLDKSSAEYTFAKDSLFERHPEMKTWPEDHGFYLAKIDPVQIRLLGHHGPVKEISKDTYLSADISSLV